MYRHRIGGLIAIPLLMVACATPGAPSEGPASVAPFASQADPVATEPASSQGGAGGLATAEITLVNGPQAGHYTDEGSEEGCRRDHPFPGAFSVSRDVLNDSPDGFSGYLVIFIDASTVGSGTDGFQFQVRFTGNNESLQVLPSAIGGGEGSGTATLDDRGDTATITIEATTEEGIEMSAVIECHTITSQ